MTTKSYKEFLKEQLRNPEFAAAYYELEPEFQVAREVIRLRLEKGLTQEELAELVGTKQSGISRLENASVKPTFGFLQKVAEALGVRIEIHLRSIESTKEN
jgi:transcriptional regulator with XRE-family HTH domain